MEPLASFLFEPTVLGESCCEAAFTSSYVDKSLTSSDDALDAAAMVVADRVVMNWDEFIDDWRG